MVGFLLPPDSSKESVSVWTGARNDPPGFDVLLDRPYAYIDRSTTGSSDLGKRPRLVERFGPRAVEGTGLLFSGAGLTMFGWVTPTT